jgi:hypothetical protein
VEVKGESARHPHPAAHNAFPSVLGQILSRMDKEGNHPNKARTYAIGIPKVWERIYKNKIAAMEYGWRLLRVRVFLVDGQGGVEERPYSYFLR